MNALIPRFVWVLLCMILPMTAFSQYRVEVPYTEENGKFIVEVKVNGHPGRFLIDTGAPCAISHTFLQKVGKADGLSTDFYDSNGNAIKAQLTVIDCLTLGGVQFQKLQAISLPPQNIIKTFHVDGIIGYNLFRMGSIRLNGKKRTFTLSSSPCVTPSDSVYAIPMVKDPFLPVIAVGIGMAARDTVMFDCGASGYYTLSSKAYTRLTSEKAKLKKLSEGVGILSAGASGVERGTRKYRVKIPQFSIGNSTFKDLTTITTSAKQSRIGTGFLQFGDIAIDYSAGLFYYIPYVLGTTPNLYEPEWNVVIIAAQDKLLAGMVWDTKHTSLRGGEQITEINGTSYRKGVDMYQAVTRGVIPAGENTLSIKYIDPATGEERSATLHRK